MHNTHHTINLEADTCPSREERVGAIKAYYGKLSDLLDESKRKEGRLDFKSRPFQQSSWCVHTSGQMRLMTIRDAAFIAHAPIGCSSYMLAQSMLYKNVPDNPAFELHGISSDLDEKDIVYGGEAKLRNTIKEAESRYSPKSIFVMTSCASGIMGDDIEGVVKEIQPEVKAKIVPIHCEGFRSQIWQTSFDAIWHAIVKYLVREPRTKQEDLINIPVSISHTWGDRREITRLLGKLGLRANFVPEFATTEQLEIMSEAALTVPLCVSYGDYLAKALEEKYDVPYFLHPAPLGLANTEEWLRKIAEYTDKEKEVAKLIDEERTAIMPHIEAFRKELHNKGRIPKMVFGWAGSGRAVGLPVLANELGFKTIGTCTFEYDMGRQEGFEDLYKKCGDLDVHVSDIQPFEQEILLERWKPDIYTTCPMTGGVNKRPIGTPRIHSFRGDLTNYGIQYGYAGVLGFGDVMLRALNNPSFNKNVAANTKKPYKEWLYSQEAPLIKEEEA